MRKKRFTVPIAVLILMAMVFAGCSGTGNSGPSRTNVQDGTYITEGWGNNLNTPITVATTFAGNAIVNISVGRNQETAPMLETVRNLYIPRVIQNQSLGDPREDAISGASNTSQGVRDALAAAIDLAQGNSEDAAWNTIFPRNYSSKSIVLPAADDAYDVVVIGLGGAGMAAYTSAAEEGKTVFGIEWAAKIGGNTATAGGPNASASQGIADLYANGTISTAGISDALAQFRAYNDVPPYEGNMGRHGPNDAVHASGGGKESVQRKFMRNTGAVVTWLMGYGVKFTSGGTYANDNWVYSPPAPPFSSGGWGYESDDPLDVHKTIVFTRVVEQGKVKNPKNGYMLELRAEHLRKVGSIFIVEARNVANGAKYEIRGTNVILATGGYIANERRMIEHFDNFVKTEAVRTEQGDGIIMGIEAGGGTYNYKMPAITHIGQVYNIVQTPIDPVKFPAMAASPKTDGIPNLERRWKSTLTSLLLKGDNLLVGVEQGHDGEDRRGKRFTNEAGFFDGPQATNWRSGGYFAAIFSKDMIEDMKANGAKFVQTSYFLGQHVFPPGSMGSLSGDWQSDTRNPYPPNVAIPDIYEILEWGIDTGNVVKASSIAELERELKAPGKTTGIPAGNLAATITRYNALPTKTISGMFGPEEVEVDWEKSVTYLQQINPDDEVYYAVLGAGYYYATPGGLDVNDNFQVLAKTLPANKTETGGRAVVGGLYAVGQDSMAVMYRGNDQYGIGGSAMGYAITSGYIAGKHAAGNLTAAAGTYLDIN